jgi:hypothetical protein
MATSAGEMTEVGFDCRLVMDHGSLMLGWVSEIETILNVVSYNPDRRNKPV